MPGEHWCSVCEDDVRKHGDTYVKITWYTFTAAKSSNTAIVCEECEAKNKDRKALIEEMRAVARPQEVKRGRACSICEEGIAPTERSLQFEFVDKGKERHANICNKCILERKLEDFKVLKQNPNFRATIHCASHLICRSFKKPTRNRGINCQNIVVNMNGELYCRKAHPGHLKVYRERWVLPPSRKKTYQMLNAFVKLMTLQSAWIEARYGSTVEEASALGAAEREIAGQLFAGTDLQGGISGEAEGVAFAAPGDAGASVFLVEDNTVLMPVDIAIGETFLDKGKRYTILSKEPVGFKFFYRLQPEGVDPTKLKKTSKEEETG